MAQGVGDLISIEGGSAILEKNLVFSPVFEKAGSSGVSIIRGLIVWKFLAQVQSDHIVLMAAIIGLLRFRGDDIVGWGDDLIERGHLFRVVKNAPESIHVNH